MAIKMDLCGMMARVRDVRVDDVKATTIKEKEKENTCLMYVEIFTSQNPIQIFHKHYWCARPRPVITCYIYIIKHDFSCILKHK